MRIPSSSSISMKVPIHRCPGHGMDVFCLYHSLLLLQNFEWSSCCLVIPPLSSCFYSSFSSSSSSSSSINIITTIYYQHNHKKNYFKVTQKICPWTSSLALKGWKRQLQRHCLLKFWYTESALFGPWELVLERSASKEEEEKE